MQLHIFNVGHGSCACLVANNGNIALFDCGHDDEVGFRPSTYLAQRGCTGIEHLVVSHNDEDHVSDLPGLIDLKLPINTLHRNRSLTADQIRGIKQRDRAAVGPGLNALFGMLGTFTATAANPPELRGVVLRTFRNPYPAFQDTNNLSLVTFVRHANVSIVLPGDLEKAGWEVLLRNDDFRAELNLVRVFVAAHHGRENGYLPAVFDHCAPDIVIISDTAMQYDSQEHCYARHARGVRYVLTTRRDGHVTIAARELGYRITTSRQLP